MESSVTSLHNK